MDDDEPTKRQRAAASEQPASAQPAAQPPPAAWPSASSLYAAGLEQRAEAATTETSWAINAQEWRASGFSTADADGTTLKQRQMELWRHLRDAVRVRPYAIFWLQFVQERRYRPGGIGFMNEVAEWESMVHSSINIEGL